MTDRIRIGICGGTFDPFHHGHHEPVLSARAIFDWSRLLYVPAFIQPFKTTQHTASSYHRFAMCVLGTLDDSWSEVVPWELERGTISYSVDTLEMIATANPDATLDWIIGDDNLPTLGAWKDIDRIFDLANFVVLTRGGATVPAAFSDRVRTTATDEKHGAIFFAHNNTIPISATDIRRRIREGQPLEAVVDPRVGQYIQRHRLYQ